MKKLYLIISILIILGIGVTGIYLVTRDRNKHEINKLYEEMAQETIQDEEPEPEPEEPKVYIPPKTIDWESLHNTNPDVFAWIYVPDTNIDYPVLRHESDDIYYLNNNIDGSPGYPGCIYCEPTYNKRDVTDKNLVLYGHNMRDGTMFATLHSFENKEFFDGQRYIYIYHESGENYAYEIFAAYPRDDYHLLDGYEMDVPEHFEYHLNEIRTHGAAGYVKDDIFPATEDSIITLSTCIGNDQTSRYLVQGVRR